MRTRLVNRRKLLNTIAVTWMLIGGHLIAYYEPCSVLVHHGMVREYIDSVNPSQNHTNAANFNHVISRLRIPR